MSSFQHYRDKTDQFLQHKVHQMGEKTLLRDACEYAVMNGGKRMRPVIVLMVGDALSSDIDLSSAAAAIEFFHTASLVVDDLPCMDNDALRRNRPTVHKVYGETMALLVSYALIAAGYELLYKNGAFLKNGSVPFSNEADLRCCLALENASFNTGLNGATGGQFLDVAPPDLSLATVRDVLHKKTASLFEISFLFGWLFGGGDLQKLPLVKKAAAHFGMAFQIADDLGDMVQDLKNERKVNVATILGANEAKKVFHVELSAFHQAICDLKIEQPLRLLEELISPI